MFKKILIANRGEIACRVIKTARKMGIKTVAVYSDADREAMHVSMADEAVHIGAPAASESYLVIEKIIAACKATGAEAVHPGYGFLSEREAFATALKDNGIVFIGPNAHAIAAMGDKIESKLAAQAAGVSTVPGHMGIIEDENEAVLIADKIGYPVMIKASAGGGGKGMRIAHAASEVKEGFRASKSEALSSFGDDRIFIEKFIVNPRHIEIQLLGDKHGNVIYLGERECSIQRRNQKVIEEAPSPLLDEETRRKMGEQSVALAKAVGYDSAGTVEFVAGQDKSFYFLEMNTRLQVEHPVTEMITGIDLVEQMIRVAYGEKLKIKQSDVKLNGWAVESRVYAEDPYRNFLPSIGRLVKYRPPAEEQKGEAIIRNDTGVYEGGEISIYYDPMIAKLVSWAPTRLKAIEAQADALDAFYIEGIRHNIPFVSALMHHPRWRAGELSTGFIAEEYKDGFKPRDPSTAEAETLALIACYIDNMMNDRKREITGQMIGVKRVAFAKQRVIMLNKERIEIRANNGENFSIHGKSVTILSEWTPGNPVFNGKVDGVEINVLVKTLKNGLALASRGLEVTAHVYTKREAELVGLMLEKTAADTGKKLLCPMPGLVKAILVTQGQEVKAGEALAIVEAMKMENVLRAERDVKVKLIKAKAGDSLAVDALIMEFE